jgi:tellurite methyltransferase
MSGDDAERWNRRYLSDGKFTLPHPASLLLNHLELLPPNGLALDVAMGLGGNSIPMCQHGLRVIGVDISTLAIRKAKELMPELMGVVADMENFFIPPAKFDVILDILYFQRNIWKKLMEGLKPGGISFIECLTKDMLSINPTTNPDYLVKPGELERSVYQASHKLVLETLFYEEGWITGEPGHQRSSARLIVRRMG